MTCNNENKSLSLRKDQRGLSTVEYVLVFVLVVVAAIGTWKTFSGVIQAKVAASGAKFASEVQ